MFRLLEDAKDRCHPVPWVLLENVRMIALGFALFETSSVHLKQMVLKTVFSLLSRLLKCFVSFLAPMPKKCHMAKNKAVT